ncbi:hypothetical protein [Streptomyces sp. NBC_00690]|nr:hypothetical protein [Streptomyces sp. NBC_00690]
MRTVGVYELIWSSSGRATWRYGTPARPGHPRIIGRRIGGHNILTSP